MMPKGRFSEDFVRRNPSRARRPSPALRGVSFALFALAAAFPCGARAAEEEPEAETPEAEQARIDAAIRSLPTIYETRTRFFDVYAGDVARMRRVAFVAERLESQLAAILPRRRDADGAKLSVRVETDPRSAALFEVGRDYRRNAACTLFADVLKLDDYEIAYALAQTALRQYGKEVGLKFANAQPPRWAVSALAEETALSGRHGALQLFRRRSLELAPPSLAELFDAATDARAAAFPPERFRAGAFWFYRWLRRRPLAAWQQFPAFFVAVLREPVATAFPQKKNAPADAAELAWRTAYFAAIERVPAGTESPGESGRRFAEATRFVVGNADGKPDERVGADALIERREALGVKKLAFARLVEIREALPTTNPVWHNAFVELGIFLEKIAERADESRELREGSSIWAPQVGTRDRRETAELRALWESVEKRRAEAETLQREIRALLDAPPPAPDAETRR